MDKKVKIGGKKEAPEIEKTKPEVEKVFDAVTVIDPRSGMQKRIMTQAQLDLHLQRGWKLKS